MPVEDLKKSDDFQQIVSYRGQVNSCMIQYWHGLPAYALTSYRIIWVHMIYSAHFVSAQCHV